MQYFQITMKMSIWFCWPLTNQWNRNLTILFLKKTKPEHIIWIDTSDCNRNSNIENTKCSVTCGMGTKTRTAICVHQQQIVNFSQCKDQPKPKEIYINCSMDPCYRKVLFRFKQTNNSNHSLSHWMDRLALWLWRAKLHSLSSLCACSHRMILTRLELISGPYVKSSIICQWNSTESNQ